MGLILHFDAYIYEYFVYMRNGEVQPGMMVAPSGIINEPGYSLVSSAMEGFSLMATTTSKPCFFYVSVPCTARKNEFTRRVNRAVYRLAGYLLCRIYPFHAIDKIPQKAVLLLSLDLEQVLSQTEMEVLTELAGKNAWHLAGTRKICRAL